MYYSLLTNTTTTMAIFCKRFPGVVAQIVLGPRGSSAKICDVALGTIDLATHKDKAKQVGDLLGIYETNNRVTCL